MSYANNEMCKRHMTMDRIKKNRRQENTFINTLQVKTI